MQSIKQADPVLDAAHSDLAMQQFKKILLLGAGAGMAARGATGFMHMLNRNAQPAPSSPMAANILPFTVPQRQEREKAADGAAPAGITAAPYSHNWWAMPLHAVGGAGAAIGGYKLMDYLLDQQRHKGLKEEVDQAKTDFEKALGQQPIGSAKMASDKATKISQQLDEIFELTQKTADWAPLLAGLAATAALPVVAGAGYMGFRMAKNDRQSEQLDAAAKERQRRRQQSSAPFVVAVPESDK